MLCADAGELLDDVGLGGVAQGGQLAVRIGRERTGQVEVLSGLAAGDQVIAPAGTVEGK